MLGKNDAGTETIDIDIGELGSIAHDRWIAKPDAILRTSFSPMGSAVLPHGLMPKSVTRSDPSSSVLQIPRRAI